MRQHIELLKLLFVSNGMMLKDKGKREVTIEKFGSDLYKKQIVIPFNELEEKYREVVTLLYTPTESPLDIVREALPKEKFYNKLVAKWGKEGDSLIYFNDSDESHFIGAAKDLNPRTVHDIMKAQKYHKLVNEWKTLLTPYAGLLKLNVHNVRELIETVWEKLYSAEHEMPQLEVDFSQPPALLETFGVGSEYTIPFTKKHSTLEDLHPMLSDFLTRMEDHKYFCAILAGRLIGHNRAYVPWLMGPGGDGKSSFFEFLKLILPRRTATIDLAAEYPNLTDAIGKTLLFIPDTSKKNIFHNDMVKNISGGDGISINAKYKHPITVTLPGLIIISSNKTPNIGKAAYAKRRARRFKITPGNFEDTDKELSVAQVGKRMHSTSNEFLNYCIQCLEEVGNLETGYVSMPKSNVTKDSKTLEEHSYHDFMESHNLILDSSIDIEGRTLRTLLDKEKRDKGEYFKDNFLEYIEKYYKVTMDDRRYYGIGKKNQQHINKLTKEIEESMPK